jgi:hypothetical protein
VGTVPIIVRGLGNLADDPKTFWEGVKHLFLVILEWPLSKFRSFLCFCYDKEGVLAALLGLLLAGVVLEFGKALATTV